MALKETLWDDNSYGTNREDKGGIESEGKDRQEKARDEKKIQIWYQIFSGIWNSRCYFKLKIC